MNGRKKRILIFHPALAPYRVDFFNWLGTEFEVRIVFLSKQVRSQAFNQEELLKGATYQYGYLSKKIVLANRDLNWGYGKEIRSFRPDVVVGSEYGLSTLMPLLLRKFYRLNYKMMALCDDSLDIAKTTSGPRKRFKDWVLPRLDALLVLSEKVAHWYEKETPIKRTLVFPLIRDEAAYLVSKPNVVRIAESYVQTWDLQNRFVYLSVARLHPVKNLMDLVLAFSKLSSENQVLILVGEGEQRAELEAKVKELNLENRVLLPGRFEGDALHAWYQLADVFVLASHFEPFGAVVNEALMSGCFCLCSETVGAAELLNPSNGMTFPPGDLNRLEEGMKMARQKVMQENSARFQRNSRMKVQFATYARSLKSYLEKL